MCGNMYAHVNFYTNSISHFLYNPEVRSSNLVLATKKSKFKAWIYILITSLDKHLLQQAFINS